MINEILLLDPRILFGIITALVASLTTIFVFTLTSYFQRKQRLIEVRPDFSFIHKKTSIDNRKPPFHDVANIIRFTRDFAIKGKNVLIKSKEEKSYHNKSDVKALVFYIKNESDYAAINLKLIYKYNLIEEGKVESIERKFKINRLNSKDVLIIPLDLINEKRVVSVEKLTRMYNTIYGEKLKNTRYKLSGKRKGIYGILSKIFKNSISIDIKSKRKFFIYFPYEISLVDRTFLSTFTFEKNLKDEMK